jgi:predicted amidohydrolase YtcJ
MAPPDRRLHDEDWRIAQAIAIRDGRFLAVGDDAAIAAHIGPNTQVVELAGKTVVPGLIDSHLHQLFAGLNGPAVQLLGFEAVSSGLADMYHASEITWAGRSAAFLLLQRPIRFYAQRDQRVDLP